MTKKWKEDFKSQVPKKTSLLSKYNVRNKIFVTLLLVAEKNLFAEFIQIIC